MTSIEQTFQDALTAFLADYAARGAQIDALTQQNNTNLAALSANALTISDLQARLDAIKTLVDSPL